MPKMKTKKSAAKRFVVRPGGTVKRGQAFNRDKGYLFLEILTRWHRIEGCDCYQKHKTLQIVYKMYKV